MTIDAMNLFGVDGFDFNPMNHLSGKFRLDDFGNQEMLVFSNGFDRSPFGQQ
jgi:hypothetical protein